MRDGAERFAHGLGAESNFGEHVTVLLLRVALVVYLWITSSRLLGGRTRASS